MAATAQREIRLRAEDGVTALSATHDGTRPTRQGGLERIEEHREWTLLSQIPMLLSAGVKLPRFTVRDLLALKVAQTVESVSSISDDVPLKIGAVQLGWIEFEVVAQRMAVRLTRLA